ncbi:MAG TPA: glycoside hydrolase family 2 TIM barrel-domain containing protein [Chloroflexaceae bacterium]|nr:glycoside hydrolase family 2 TIM barrel-domain containing protein [Chloroflexaceae bacterium]
MERTRISLDGQWEFFVDPDERLTADDLATGEARSIAVPGPWQAQFDDLRSYAGQAWYRRSFEVPAEDGPRTWVLHFGAVDYLAAVYLNGRLLAEHEGGYLPFELPLDGALRPGEANELVVRVCDPGEGYDAPGYPFAEIPHGKQSWYGPIGGIWQSVWIEARHPTHLTRLRLTPDVPGACVRVELALARPAPGPLIVRLTVTDPRGAAKTHERQLAAGAERAAYELPIPDPLLWDTRSPNLYRLEAALHDGEGPSLDGLGSHFGMRTIAASPDGRLMLNGRVLYLRGALDQDYYPQLIYTPFSDAELDDQFAKAKHMGLNCLRTHIKITDPRYYDAADRAGLLIWTELPNWENLTEGAKARARATLEGMVERDWNHPSIIIWTIINEGWGVQLMTNPDHRAWLAETYQFLKALDPHRLIVGNSPCWGNFHVVTDIEDFHNYYSIPDHYRKWRSWVQTFAARPSWTFAYDAAENLAAWQSYLRDPWDPTPRTPAPEVTRRGNEPMVISEFGNWGLPDIARLKACYGGEPWWFETGIEWGDGVTYPHGIEQRFRAYHLDKVFGDLGQLAAASQRMQFTALKYQIEQMRRHPSIVGYIITEFTDVHWEANGLLDLCRNPKAYYDVIGNINDADAIVPDWERVAFWEGERVEIRLALSHFSPEDLRDSRLTWHLDLWPELAGSFEGIFAQPATVTSVGTVVFTVPPVERGVRARLELELRDAEGALVTSNHQELYAFPRAAGGAGAGAPRVFSPDLADDLTALGYRPAAGPDEADVVVTTALTDEWRWRVQRGGRVLWLAESAEALQTNLGPVGIAQRKGRSWAGDWASNFNWIRQDKLFQQIPSGGTVDFAFADLVPDYVIVGLSPRDFAAHVHAGLTVGWLHHTVALIAERRYGAGRLLISTFRLREQLRTHPVAQIMLGDMLAFLKDEG